MPDLPRGDIKIVLRPRGWLHVSEVTCFELSRAIAAAAQIPANEASEDVVCLNLQHNIVVVSTSKREHADRYVAVGRIDIRGTAHERLQTTGLVTNASPQQQQQWRRKWPPQSLPIKDTIRGQHRLRPPPLGSPRKRWAGPTGLPSLEPATLNSHSSQPLNSQANPQKDSSEVDRA
ncbi:hypothetical protein HPB49_011219 [Dermacentor silvarum]|uniref:Uncharacterized protein n=1 Tax=Dermacentor silvarum TaxID=543639 RepID=A0ACB8CWU1_DERSI|nr:hypothetical protein HPB49_011219 [Dermacentor silvarum]